MIPHLNGWALSGAQLVTTVLVCLNPRVAAVSARSWDASRPDDTPPAKPILLFSMRLDYFNRCFVKRNCFHYMGLDTPRFTDAMHTCASFFVCKKTPFTVSFFEEWLRYAQDPQILTNAPNQYGLPDYPEFFQHRNDQAILSLLGRKYEIPTCPDISQWGNTLRPAEIPQIIEHTRWGA
jgi:hypothetical protein